MAASNAAEWTFVSTVYARTTTAFPRHSIFKNLNNSVRSLFSPVPNTRTDSIHQDLQDGVLDLISTIL